MYGGLGSELPARHISLAQASGDARIGADGPATGWCAEW